MDFTKLLSYVLCMVVSLGLDLISGQPPFIGSSFGRRGFLGRRTGFYPRYPDTGFGGQPFIRDPYFNDPFGGLPAVLPTVPIVRPDFTSDRSANNDVNVNVVNNNKNIHDQRGSGNVQVTQGRGSTCQRPCINGYCESPFERCMYDPQCEGNLGCRSFGMMK